MDTRSSLYIVPIDFTTETENAYEFALGIGKFHKSKVMLLHIIPNHIDRIGAEGKLKTLSDKHDPDGEHTLLKVIVGSVLKDIGVIAEALGASLIVMGTHGSSVLQKVFGSPALKVVSHSKVPIILVQKQTEFHGIKTIVMNIDLERESIQVVRYAAYLAKSFNSKVILVGKIQEDELLMRKISINMKLANDYLHEAGLDTAVHMIPQHDFETNLIDYCKEINADMLAVTYYQETFHLFSANLVQSLSENPLHIPVMTYDGEDTSIGSQFGFITQ